MSRSLTPSICDRSLRPCCSILLAHSTLPSCSDPASTESTSSSPTPRYAEPGDSQATQTVLNDSNIRVLSHGVRSALRSAAGYDLVIWPLRESFQGVAAGTFGLRETYALTREALAGGFRALAPDGRLIVTRWLQATPSESVRMWASLLDALRLSGVSDPAEHVLAWRSLEVVTMVASPTPFTATERQALSDGLERDGFDWVFHVKLLESDSNRFNRLPDTSLYQAFQAVVRGDPILETWAPVTDDRPYFFHYFDWTQWREVLSTTGRTWQPFGGAGFLVLIPLAAAATGAAVLTMVAPLIGSPTWRRGPASGYAALSTSPPLASPSPQPRSPCCSASSWCSTPPRLPLPQASPPCWPGPAWAVCRLAGGALRLIRPPDWPL